MPLANVFLQPVFQVGWEKPEGPRPTFEGDIAIHANGIEAIRPGGVGTVYDIVFAVDYRGHRQLEQRDALFQVCEAIYGF